MKSRINILILFLILGVSISFGQSASLEVVGYVESDAGSPIKTAKAELFEGERVVKSVTADLKGKISFKLEFNKTYKIVVSKPGMTRKRVDFKTDVAPENQRNLRKEFGVTLFESCEGANVSAFNEPADIVTYDESFGNFVSDNSHYEGMQAKFAEARRSLDKCKQDKFDEKKSQADKQFNEGNFDKAIEIYQEALKVFPNDGSVKRQIAAARKSQGKSQLNDERYQQIIKEADLLLSQNNMNAAKQRYAAAQKLKPSEGYPKEKLAEINSVFAKQASELQAQKALDSEYADYMKQGNTAFAAKNFPLAQQLYQKAANLKPNEALASQKVSEAQQALVKQQEVQAEIERINTAYQTAMTSANAALQQGDYKKAEELYLSALALKPTEALPRQKINEAQKLEEQKKKQQLADLKAEIERKYSAAIAKADALLAQSDYPGAVTAFEEALVIKPSDKYAQQQVVKINNLIVKEEQAKQAAIEKAYNDAILLGDTKKLAKDFPTAISAYEQALAAKPNDPIAVNKLSV